MTQSSGLVGLLYGIKAVFEAGIVWLITGFAILSFFYFIIKYIAQIRSGKIDPDFGKKVLFSIFVLFVIFALYSLIGLTASLFGINSSPSGGIYLR